MSSSGGISTDVAHNEAGSQDSTIAAGFDLPAVDQVLASLSGPSSSLPARDHEKIDQGKQYDMFCALKNVIEHAEGAAEAGNSFDLKELHASLEQADAEARRGRRDVDALRNVHAVLGHLWSCNSGYLVQAAEILANGSRDRESFGYLVDL